MNELLNLVALTTGLVLYAMLLAMVVSGRQRPVAARAEAADQPHPVADPSRAPVPSLITR